MQYYAYGACGTSTKNKSLSLIIMSKWMMFKEMGQLETQNWNTMITLIAVQQSISWINGHENIEEGSWKRQEGTPWEQEKQEDSGSRSN